MQRGMNLRAGEIGAMGAAAVKFEMEFASGHLIRPCLNRPGMMGRAYTADYQV